jgi:hypothetical protein
MRTLAVACLSILACGGPAPEKTRQACVPATGPASFLAGNWHAPDPPSDFTIDLVLEGGPAGICGTGASRFPGTDAGGGPSFIISGTEQKLLFESSSGSQGWNDVVREDVTHVQIGHVRYVRR